MVMFDTEVTQDVAYNDENPTQGAGLGDNTGNAADLSNSGLSASDLKALTTYLQQTNVPSSSTTLPPQYYYPSQQGVAIGQMSGPMGSLTTYSPGAPLFPMSVLDAVEKENKAMKAKWLEDQLKSWDIKYYHVDQAGLDDEFQKWQQQEWDAFQQEYLEKAGGNWAMARKMAERDGAFKRKASEIEAVQRNVNQTYGSAVATVEAFESGKSYVSQKSYDAANKWLELVSAGDFRGNFNEIQKAKDEFVVAVSMDDASKEIVAGINATVVDNPNWNSSLYDATGKPVATSIDKLVENIKNTGLSAYFDEAGMKELDSKIDASWDAKYGQAGAKMEYMPDKEKYRTYVKSIVQDSMVKNLQHIKNTDAYNQAYANRKANETLITPVERTMIIGGKPRKVVVHGLGYGSGIKGGLVGGFRGTYIDPVTGQKQMGTDAKGYITGVISGVDDKGNVITYYELTDYTPGSATQGQIRIVPSNTEIDAVYDKYLKDNNIIVSGEVQESGSATGTNIYEIRADGKTYGSGKTDIEAESTTNKPAAY